MENNKAFLELNSVFNSKSKNIYLEYENPLQFVINEVLRFMKMPIPAITVPVDDENLLDTVLSKTGGMKKTVNLTEKFYKNLAIPVITEIDGVITVVKPFSFGEAKYFDFSQRKYKKITAKNLLSQSGIMIYKPLIQKETAKKTLFDFVKKSVTKMDVAGILLLELAVILLGLVLPFVNQQIFETVIPSGTKSDIFPIALLVFSVIFGVTIFTIVKSTLSNNFINKLNAQFQGALQIKLLSLPVNFYKDHKAGDLTSRIMEFGDLTNIVTNGVISGLTGGIFSIVYLFQIFAFQPVLVMPTVIIVSVMLIFLIIEAYCTIKWQKKYMEKSAKASGTLFEMFSGIAKIKLTASEGRAFYRWSKNYSDIAKIQYSPPFMVKYGKMICKTIFLLATAFIFIVGSKYEISASSYIAFSSAYGVLIALVLGLDTVLSSLTLGKLSYDMLKPILEEKCENTYELTDATIDGNITVSNLKFKYDDDLVIDDVSLSIKSGEYVAIVGSSGCGKSTLVRLLLGFEKPLTGAIYYDNCDMKDISMKSLRRQTGVVMQSGKLFSGDIYSNITISAPNMDTEEVWKIAEMAGIKDDISAMTMGLYTILSDGGGGLSGGQKQKLMIARAIAQKPKLLIFDEATSALDNITQSVVSKSISTLHCTRIVIAHRLSTIMDADTIFVMDKGKIVQKGTYDQLLKEEGLFKSLAMRQLQ